MPSLISCYGLCAGYLGGKAAYTPIDIDIYVDFDMFETIDTSTPRREQFERVTQIILGNAEEILDRPRLRTNWDTFTISEMEIDEIEEDVEVVTSEDELNEILSAYFSKCVVMMEKKRSGAFWRKKGKR